MSDFDHLRFTSKEVANFRISRHLQQANLVDRGAVIDEFVLLALLVTLECDTVVAQVDAAPEIIKRLLFIVR